MGQLIRVVWPRVRARSKKAAPVILDVLGFAAVTVGAALLWGEVAWIVAGMLLILSAMRAQS